MSTPPRKRSYRKHHLTSWGETIIGLTKSADGRFRPIGHSTPAWSGDEAKVIHRFRMWQAEQDQGGTTLQEIDDASGIHFGPTAEGKIYWTRYYHELLVRDPRQAAVELDDERLARLNELGRREPSLLLSEIGELYQPGLFTIPVLIA